MVMPVTRAESWTVVDDDWVRSNRPSAIWRIWPGSSAHRTRCALLAETGMRIGQALGLRHEDFVSRERRVMIVPRVDNVNGARAKFIRHGTSSLRRAPYRRFRMAAPYRSPARLSP